MKRTVRSVIFLCILLVPFVSYASIGENFLAAGSYLSGSAGIEMDFGSFEAPELSFYEVWVSPSIGFFPVNNLSLSVGASLDLWDYPLDLLYTMRWTIIGAVNLTRYFVSQPDASAGLVPAVSLGTNIGYNAYYGSVWINLFPGMSLYYFISERVAPYVSLSGIGVGLGLVPSVSFYTWLNPRLTVGVSWFIPSKDRAMF